MAQAQQIKEERSLGELFSELSKETSTLVRQEVALAQVEITKKARRVGTNIGYLVVGGTIAYVGSLVLVATLIIGLAQLASTLFEWTITTSLWVIGLIVGSAIVGIGYMLATKALETLKNTDLKPEQTIETVKEDIEWIKKEVT